MGVRFDERGIEHGRIKDDADGSGLRAAWARVPRYLSDRRARIGR